MFDVLNILLTRKILYAKQYRKRCFYPEIFWSVFFRIWPDYGVLLCKSPYSVQMRENKVTFYAVDLCCFMQEI